MMGRSDHESRVIPLSLRANMVPSTAVNGRHVSGIDTWPEGIDPEKRGERCKPERVLPGGSELAEYFIAYEADLRSYPNYSLEIGDVDGDGQMEFVCLNQSGNRLRVLKLDGRVLLEKRLYNFGNWGTIVLSLADLDGDGREEIVTPCLDRSRTARIVALNAAGEELRAHCFETREKDAYGIGVPLLARMRLRPSEPPGVFAGVAGGTVVALDSEFNELWRFDDLRRDFGHEPHVADVDGDGLDEIAFCTVDDINRGTGDDNVGELILLDHDGTLLLRRRVGDYAQDTHFDDVAMADFQGLGRSQVLLEKGLMVDLAGEVVWNVSDQLNHGQWIAHTPAPGGKGRLIFISELWGGDVGGSALISPEGRVRWTIRDLPRTQLGTDFPGWRVLPTRPHFVRWAPDSEPELFVAEQTTSPTSHDCFQTREFGLKAFFLDLQGDLVGTLPFSDAQVEGYWYNGEVHSRVADVDGDGQEEIIFPRQNGRVMVIKKRMG